MATLAAPAAPRARGTPVLRKRVLVYAGLTFYAVLAGLPVYWMFVTTFKADRDLYNLQTFPLWFNQAPTLDHLNLLFNKTGFSHWLLNTFIVAIGVVAITLIVAVPAGYALARLRFMGSETLSIGVFLTYLIPTTLLFLPLVKVIAGLGLFDKLGSLIVAYPTFTIPFCTWLMAGFFRTIPQEIEEAAMVDGSSRIGAIPRV